MRVLIADDEAPLADGLAQYLRKAGHEVCTVTTGGLDVLPACDWFQPDVILLDVMMPRFNGIAVAHGLLSRNPAANVILCSGSLAPDHPFITQSGVRHFIAKPFTFARARKIIESLAPPARRAA